MANNKSEKKLYLMEILIQLRKDINNKLIRKIELSRYMKKLWKNLKSKLNNKISEDLLRAN